MMHPFFRSRPSGKARIGKKGQTRPRSRVPRLERLEERLAPASADLSVMQTASNAVAGGNVTYTLTVQNLGPDPATGVTLTDSLPTETMYMSSTTTQGTITPPTTGGQGTLQGDLFFTIYSGTPNVLKRSFTYNGTTLTFNSGNVNVAASDGADGATFAPNGQLIVGGQNKNAVNEVRGGRAGLPRRPGP